MHTTGKGRKERTTPLTRQTAHTLRAWMPEAGAIPSGPVFPTRRQTSMSADAVQRLVAKHAATAAISCPSIAARPDADCNEPEVVRGKQSREDERANKAKGANAEPTQNINRCAGHRALPNFSGAQALLVMRLVTAGIGSSRFGFSFRGHFIGHPRRRRAPSRGRRRHSCRAS